jgi:hypothetical protein
MILRNDDALRGVDDFVAEIAPACATAKSSQHVAAVLAAVHTPAPADTV